MTSSPLISGPDWQSFVQSATSKAGASGSNLATIWQQLPRESTFCQPLKQSESDKDKDKDCPKGTYVCANKWYYREEKEPFLESVVPIAGDLGSSQALEPTKKYPQVSSIALRRLLLRL